MTLSPAKIQRYPGIDALKLICALLVIHVHAAYPGTFGVYTKALSRIAVPVFFMISGFFFHDHESDAFILRQLKKMLSLFLFANLVYFCWNILFALIQGNSPLAQIRGYLTPAALVKLFLFQDSPIARHLWYLGASAMAWCIILLARKLHCYPVLCRFWPILLIVNLAFGIYAPVLLGIQIPPTLVRSGYFTGLPFIMMGRFLRSKEAFLKAHFSTAKLLLLTALCACAAIGEKYLLLTFCGDPEGDTCFTTILLAAALFLLFAIPSRQGAVTDKLAAWGKKLSLPMYLYHILFVNLLLHLAHTTPAGNVILTIFPIAVALATMVFSAAIQALRHWAKRLPGADRKGA